MKNDRHEGYNLEGRASTDRMESFITGTDAYAALLQLNVTTSLYWSALLVTLIPR